MAQRRDARATDVYDIKKPTPTFGRGEPRPVRRRTRTFRPNYRSFAGTYQCNLSCPHRCVPIEWPDRLEIAVAVRFLEDAFRLGIRTLGFTGGEPFLYAEFLQTSCRGAVQVGLRVEEAENRSVIGRGSGRTSMESYCELESPSGPNPAGTAL